MSLQLHHLQHRLAARRAEVFNGRYRLGDPVLYIAAPGEVPQWDRTYGAAFVRAGRSIVQLAGREIPVETDKLYTPPSAPTRCPEAKLGRRLWKSLGLFGAGFATAVAIALMVPPVKATPPTRIVIDCNEPGEEPAPAAKPQERKVQA